MLTREQALENRRWFVIDAEGAVVGRLATRVADLLRGKGSPQFTPHQDCGDFVIVLNAEKIRFTGSKTDDKSYYRHTGFPGGIRETSAKRKLEDDPEFVVQAAVKGMLPRNRLGRQLAAKLKVYRGTEHPHAAQQPTPVQV
jgi:large subunit ribosomal protein L13